MFSFQGAAIYIVNFVVLFKLHFIIVKVYLTVCVQRINVTYVKDTLNYYFQSLTVVNIIVWKLRYN